MQNQTLWFRFVLCVNRSKRSLARPAALGGDTILSLANGCLRMEYLRYVWALVHFISIYFVHIEIDLKRIMYGRRHWGHDLWPMNASNSSLVFIHYENETTVPVSDISSPARYFCSIYVLQSFPYIHNEMFRAESPKIKQYCMIVLLFSLSCNLRARTHDILCPISHYWTSLLDTSATERSLSELRKIDATVFTFA